MTTTDVSRRAARAILPTAPIQSRSIRPPIGVISRLPRVAMALPSSGSSSRPGEAGPHPTTVAGRLCNHEAVRTVVGSIRP